MKLGYNILDRVIEESLVRYFNDFDYTKYLFISNKYTYIDDYIYYYFKDRFINNFYYKELFNDFCFKYNQNDDYTYNLVLSNDDYTILILFDFDNQSFAYTFL